MEALRSKLIATLRQQVRHQPLSSITYADLARASDVSWQTVKRYLGDKRFFAQYLDEIEGLPDTREKILQAAMQVFAEKGFAAGSLEAVARTAGLSKGAVYWHFANKHELVLSLLERRCEADLAALPARLVQWRQSSDPVIGLRDWLCEVLALFQADKVWSRLFIELLAQARDPSLQTRLRQLYQKLYAELAVIHRQMQIDGLTASHLPPHALAMFWVALFDGLSLAADLDLLPLDLSAFAQVIAEMTLAGSLPGSDSGVKTHA